MINLLLLLWAFFLMPFIPAIIEMRRRKDPGPRQMAESTIWKRPLKVFRPEESFRRAALKRGSAVGEEHHTSPRRRFRTFSDTRIPDNEVINGDILCHGRAKVGSHCTITGTIKASKRVTIDQESRVKGDLVCDGDVNLARGTRIEGVIVAGGNVLLGEGAICYAVSTEKTCHCEPGARVVRGIHGRAVYAIRFGSGGTERRLEIENMRDAKIIEATAQGQSLEEISIRQLIMPSTVVKVGSKYLGKKFIEASLT